MWSSSSPDIDSMDLAIWSMLESKVSAKSYSSVATMKEVLQASWSASDEEVVWSS